MNESQEVLREQFRPIVVQVLTQIHNKALNTAEESICRIRTLSPLNLSIEPPSDELIDRITNSFTTIFANTQRIHIERILANLLEKNILGLLENHSGSYEDYSPDKRKIQELESKIESLESRLTAAGA